MLSSFPSITARIAPSGRVDRRAVWLGVACGHEISQKKIEVDAARPVLAWRYDYFAHWPHVKNLVPHHTPYSYGRMQEVWLDRR